MSNVDVDTKEPVANARVIIPGFGISTKSDTQGNFKLPQIEVKGNIEPGTSGQFVNVKVVAPGFGEHTMVDVGVFPGIIATVTLELKKGDKPTKWWGLLRPEERRRKPPEPLPSPDEGTINALYSSQTVPPAQIRVAMRAICNGTEGYYCDVGKPNPKGAVIATTTVDFDFYVKHVLPQEWGPSWATSSLRAGAMAVKEYGWYWVNVGGKWTPWYGADVDNSTNDQVYNPNVPYSKTDKAVDDTAANGWYQNGKIFQSYHRRGTYSATSTCGFSNCMSQYGSKYWADQGKDYQWILNYYYEPDPTYFTIKPQSPKLYASSVSSNSITLNFSSPGAVWYQVNKWANGTWNNVVYFGPNKTFTDANLSPNQMYWYTASAWNPSGWSKWSFNNGHMRASTQPSSGLQPPITDPFYITNSEIGLRAQSSVQSSEQNVTKYLLIKVINGSWQIKYYGSPTVLDPEFPILAPDKQLPNPFIDKRDKSFYYFDKNLSVNTGYIYAIAVYDPTLGWSDFTNYDGYVYPVTQPAN